MPFDVVADALVDPIIVADDRGVIIYTNAATRAAFGYSEDDLNLAPLSTLIPERFRKAHDHGFARYNATGEARVLGKKLELVGRRRDGSEFPLEITITHVVSGGVNRFVAVLRDLSDSRAIHARAVRGEGRARELDHLRALQEFKTQFINKTAHELATPLTPMRVQAHVIGRRLEKAGDSRLAKEFDVLHRNIHRLGDLVDGIIDAAMIQSQTLGLDRHRLDLSILVAERVERIRPLSERHGVKIHTTLVPELIVEADTAHVAKVLDNLLSNAVRFNHPGGEVQVEGFQTAEDVRIRVTDTGVGVPPVARKRLFTPYADVSRAGDPTAGTGLGLYISKGIMDLHGGRIWFEPRARGDGATFWMALPSAPKPGGLTGEAARAGEPGPAR